MSEDQQNTDQTLDALDMIGMEAMRDEAAAQAAQDAILNPQDDTPPGMPAADAWAQIPMSIGMFLGSVMPELNAVFTPAACTRWGSAMALVSDKYGWSAEDTMAKWAPEIALGIATLPMAVPVYHAIKARKDAKKEDQPKKAPELTKQPEPEAQPVGGFGESAG
ncbi:hypothetical protein [Undibacterium curvum]|uniref:Uncharacterized protein n=1 Tax=Undibacterium curvum TaxID=2762294 RepID=A0ABR7A0C6_9BURK|nr:hypothetical protein [Undibacterium curvum]MBC3930368.1 hypothetical protein [Undibacterium curvum]